MNISKYLIVSVCLLLVGCTDVKRMIGLSDDENDSENSSLAVNTSVETLNAFKLIKGSLEKTNYGIDESIESQKKLLVNLEERNMNNLSIPVFEALYAEMELEIEAVEDLITTIDQTIERESDGKNEDVDVVDRLLVNGIFGKKLEYSLNELSEYFINYNLRSHVLAVTSSGDFDRLPNSFVDQFVEKFAGIDADYNFEENVNNALTFNTVVDDYNAKSKVWNEYTFHGIPVIGARTILTQLTTDLKNMKKALTSYTLEGAKASTTQKLFFYPITAENSTFLAPGEFFESTISLGAYDPNVASAGWEVAEYYVGTYTAEFTQAIANLKASNEAGEDSPGGPYAIAFGGWPFTQSAEQLAQLQKNADGNGVYNEKASVGGVISGAVKRGDFWFPFETGYNVQKAGNSSYILQKMNVMFAGVSNPIEVSLGGAQVSSASFSCGSVSGSGVSYTIKPSSPGGYEKQCTLTVKGMDKGREVSSSFPVRVRDFPPPAARHKSLRVGDTKMTRGQVCGFSNNSIVATPDENSLAALFDATFDVVSWDATITLRGEMPTKATTNQIAAACEEPTAVGATITIYNIKARAPSGTIVDLAPISYSVK